MMRFDPYARLICPTWRGKRTLDGRPMISAVDICETNQEHDMMLMLWDDDQLECSGFVEAHQ